MFQESLDRATLTLNTKLESTLVRLLKEKHLTVSICDGFTNGLLTYVLSYRTLLNPIVSSSVLCPTTLSKIQLAHLSPKTIHTHSENSPEAALEMAQNLQAQSKTKISVGVTGAFLKEDTQLTGQFTTLLCVAIITPSKTLTKKWILSGTSHSIMKQSVTTVLMMLTQLTEHYN